ncbi:M23 family metallopeptidase [Flammeovirga kamogawensis]|uniref:Peptidoglycan DD-metalloendopeptidase family protein n=1 Tax=Flammeovirga kamogawensis TaxID=373891 RepID=A0ABX8GSG2_9BACT|nr:M23 family metallopeptidase [Flammeovirga kamogawensis]MBB6463250.1 murein DD-endopeptidase MepM/ murein hydrolase activator NlpD [Flammeovirga kamogawensis]QWG05900.1 peptidoglycan DD-metalloendopeptidase family protein [Flammeovirga kamogawensis]TRX67725.1 M23 family metallopeptidase [Flammeovirga kamogawensis]
MAKIKYYYDTETCRYERVRTSTFDIFINITGLLFACSLFGFFFSAIYIKYFPSAEEARLKKENTDLLYSHKLLQKEVTEVSDVLASLQDRDDRIYRVIFEAEPIPQEIRQAGTGGSQKYQDLLDKKLAREDMILSTLSKIDNLKRQMYVQTKSYDEIVDLALNKSKMMAAIPAIQPVDNKDLKRLASGYGMRIHPILKVKKMHTGIDFSAPKGTPIYATGDGKVIKARKSNRGYGWEIEIDHGFGYVSKYAHQSKFYVKRGQKVTRGQKIGEVGSTGSSTAPHLHYEVIHKRKKVNPIKYFSKNITADQYSTLLEKASVENQSLGY